MTALERLLKTAEGLETPTHIWISEESEAALFAEAETEHKGFQEYGCLRFPNDLKVLYKRSILLGGKPTYVLIQLIGSFKEEVFSKVNSFYGLCKSEEIKIIYKWEDGVVGNKLTIL